MKYNGTLTEHKLYLEEYTTFEVTKLLSKSINYQDGILIALRYYANRPFLGLYSEQEKDFNWITFRESYLRIMVPIINFNFFKYFIQSNLTEYDHGNTKQISGGKNDGWNLRA